ncbi:hypothetical protein OG520_39370 [Streptomyces sp. NBC_00984]|uniref:hypothetical protein n=1 Tax=Streptomyces sp. NBC_00984 TaxID=2903700 RepID=UPI0038657040|nr:hypothetical protein OG520_39370 [Streptomyces sp. NBC_00984]
MSTTVPPTPAPAAPTAPVNWIPAAVTAIAVTVTLLACGFTGFLVYAYPALREPLSAAAGIAGFLGVVAALIVSMCRR